MSASVRPVTVVGIGDDGPSGLGAEARTAVEQAELLLGGRRHLAWFTGHPAQTLPITDNLRDVVAAIERHRHRRVVVLASGDPLFFGIGAYLSKKLGPNHLKILPHVSSVQLAFARVGVGWHDVTILSAHGRPLASVLRPALDAWKVAILTDDDNTPDVVAAALRAAGMEDCRAVVGEHLGGPAERVVETTLYQLPAQTFAALNVLLLLRDHPRRPPLTLGLPDEEFAHVRGQITKAEVRAVSLAKLQLRRGDTIWDIGAASGSISIEASLLCGGRAYAIERAPEQIVVLQRNVETWHAGAVHVVAGEAPVALAGLPTPDAVFVGGSGGHLREVLEAVQAQLRPGGRLVINLTTLEHLALARAWVATADLVDAELVQVQVARAVPIADDTRLAALNPVWILAATRMEGHDDG